MCSTPAPPLSSCPQTRGCPCKEECDPSLLPDGTRAYVSGSLWEGFARGDGAFRDGPYGVQHPASFYTPGFYPYGFNPEIGSVGLPEADTIRAIMGETNWDPPRIDEGEWERTGGCVEEDADEVWQLHTYIPYGQSKQQRVVNQIAAYGMPQGLEEFCEQVGGTLLLLLLLLVLG